MSAASDAIAATRTTGSNPGAEAAKKTAKPAKTPRQSLPAVDIRVGAEPRVDLLPAEIRTARKHEKIVRRMGVGLALCCALIHNPRLLFLDEPFEGIDAVASRQIKDLLLSFVARGGTIFLTSHILEIVERLSTHLGVIAQGKLVAQAPVAELRGSGGQTLEELFIGLVGGEAHTRAELDWF